MKKATLIFIGTAVSAMAFGYAAFVKQEPTTKCATSGEATKVCVVGSNGNVCRTPINQQNLDCSVTTEVEILD